MEKTNDNTKDISTTCGNSDVLDVSTTNSDWNYIQDLTDTDEKQYIMDYMQQLRQAGEDITHNINQLLETRNKLKQLGLQFYKEVEIQKITFTIFKQIGTPKEVKGYYTTFNGLYSIQWKEIDRSKIMVMDIEDYLEDLGTV